VRGWWLPALGETTGRQRKPALGGTAAMPLGGEKESGGDGEGV